MKIAVIGSGVSGIGATWALNEYSDHQVHLFEAGAYFGGHTHTVPLQKGGKVTNVDTGFIVLNPITYPNFLRFLRYLKIPLLETEMSFSVSRDRGRFEWSGSGIRAVFTQVSNLWNWEMYRMIFDILRFNTFATDLLERDDSMEGKELKEMSLLEYLDKEGYSKPFRDNYLIPMTAAIWSTKPNACTLHFPALTLIQFMHNHHLLQVTSRPAWLTIRDGAKKYIEKVISKTKGTYLNTPVSQVTRIEAKNTGHDHGRGDTGKVIVTSSRGEEEFDHVIFATHADRSLGLLGQDASELEREILGSFEFSNNVATLHSDLDLMPKRRGAWTSWNYITETGINSRNVDQVCLTYWMNNLQHISEKEFGPVLVTLNPLVKPRDEITYGSWEYSHPQFTAKTVSAQDRLHEINSDRVSFIGAWTLYGFHEDGFTSGIRAAERLGATIPFEIVDARYVRGKEIRGMGGMGGKEFGIEERMARGVLILVQWIILFLSRLMSLRKWKLE